MNSQMRNTIKGCIALSLLVALQLSAFPVSYQRFVSPDGRRIDVIGDLHMSLPEASEKLQEEKFCNAIKEIASQGKCTVLCEGTDEACLVTENELRDVFPQYIQAAHPNNALLNRVYKTMVRELGSDTVKSIEIRPEILKAILGMNMMMVALSSAEEMVFAVENDKDSVVRGLKGIIEDYRVAPSELKESRFPFFQGMDTSDIPNADDWHEDKGVEYDEALGKFIEKNALNRFINYMKEEAQGLSRIKDVFLSKIAHAIQQKPIKSHFDEMGERLEDTKRLLRDNNFPPAAHECVQACVEEVKKTGEQYAAYLAEQNEDLKKDKFSQIQDPLLLRCFDIHALVQVLAAKTNVIIYVGDLHAQTVSADLESFGFEKKESGVNGCALLFNKGIYEGIEAYQAEIGNAKFALGDAHADRIYTAMKE